MNSKRRLSLLGLALACLVPATGALAQTVPLDVELGYRFVNVSGNDDMYRSQINEREGVLLHSFSLNTSGSPGTSAFFDQIHLDASDLGAGPAGAFRLDAGRAGTYRLLVTYRRTELFSALPAFANPLLDSGVIPGQHTLNRVRNILDVDLELLPGRAITPIIGYTRNHDEGPERTTYAVGQNEFRLSSDLVDRDQELRIGAGFHFGTVSGQVTQGWRQFKETGNYSLAPGEGAGNNAGPVLGVPVTLAALSRSTSTDVNTPVTNLFVTGLAGPRVKLVASYNRANTESDTAEAESLSGSLVSFELSRFFGGLTESISSRARNTDWRANGRVEVNLGEGLDFVAGYTRRHRDLDGFALLDDIFLNTLSFAGQDPRDITQILQMRNSLERTENIYEATLSARALGPLALHIGYSLTDQDVTVNPDVAEIVVPGGQGGDFTRKVRTLSAGALFSQSGLTLGADYQRDRADDPIVRTDFLDRDRYRLRAGWSLHERLRVSLTAEQIDSSDDRSGIGFNERIRQYGGDADVTLTKPVHLRLAAEKFQADSKIPIRLPQDFSVTNSVNSEDGSSYLAGLSLLLAPVTVNGDYERFKNSGNLPFTIDRARIRGELDFTENASFVAEWAKDKYVESSRTIPNLGNFDANRYGLFLRWRQ